MLLYLYQKIENNNYKNAYFSLSNEKFSINRDGRQLNILMSFWRFVSRYMAISYKKIVNVRRDVFMVEDIVHLSHITFNNYFPFVGQIQTRNFFTLLLKP